MCTTVTSGVILVLPCVSPNFLLYKSLIFVFLCNVTCASILGSCLRFFNSAINGVSIVWSYQFFHIQLQWFFWQDNYHINLCCFNLWGYCKSWKFGHGMSPLHLDQHFKCQEILFLLLCFRIIMGNLLVLYFILQGHYLIFSAIVIVSSINFIFRCISY